MQISQAKSIILQQQSAWSKVMAEESEKQEYLKYGTVMTVLAHIATFIGSAFLASMFSFGLFHFGTTYFAVYEGLQVVLAVAMLYIIPQILAAVAPSFSGQNDQLRALKLFVFAMTPAWVGQMLGILPVVGWLGMIAGGVFAVYLFWQHATEAMSVPQDKKIGFVAVSVVAIAVVMGIITWIAGMVAGGFALTSLATGHIY